MRVLNLLKDAQKREVTYLFVAHDLSDVRFISDRMAVIRQGHILELAETEEVFNHPLHPYTKALLSAVPIPGSYFSKEKKITCVILAYMIIQKTVRFSRKYAHFVYGNQKELEAYRKL